LVDLKGGKKPIFIFPFEFLLFIWHDLIIPRPNISGVLLFRKRRNEDGER